MAIKKTLKKTKKIAPKKVSQVGKAPAKSVQLTVLDLNGKAKARISVPTELFSAKINPDLMSQAVRIHLANQRSGSASTKTRGEVEGSTRKIYRQKGTGRARHGGIRAPIFVGGGITFGPKPRDFRLDLPQKMKRAALASALTSRREAGGIIVIDGLLTLEPKTKVMVKTLAGVGAKKPLLVVTKEADKVVRAARNIDGLEILPAQNLNTYAVLRHPKLIFMKEALPVLTETFVK